MNKRNVSSVVGLAVMVGMSWASAASAQTTVEFGINGPGNGVLAGVYTDPYAGYYSSSLTSLGNGSSSTQLWNSGTPVGAFCDDFANEVNPPQYWTALDTNLSAFTGTGTVTSVYYTTAPSASSYADVSGIKSGTLTQTADYVAMAWLAYESTLASSSNPTAQEQYSYALWDIEDSSLLGSDCNTYGCLDGNGISTPTSISNSNWSAALADVSEALNVGLAFASAGNAGAAFESDPCEYNPNGAACGNKQVTVNIYSAETGGTVDPLSDTSRPQEFITVTQGSAQGVPMPEPSSLASLGFDLTGVGIAGLLFRRRQLRKG